MSDVFFLKRILRSQILTVILIILVGFLTISLYKNIKTKQELAAGLEKIREDTVVLSQKNQEFEKYLQLSQLPDFREKQIKDTYNLKKENENVYSIVGKDTVSIDNNSSSTLQTLIKSNPQKWLEYFFKK